VEENVRILILEDNPADAELMVHELRNSQLEFSSRCVDTREAFLRELEDFSPDLILADYTLPGFDAMRALRLVNERAPGVPLIIVTGSISEEVAVECMKAGATDYVLKNHLIRLAPAVLGGLDRKQARDQKERAEQALRESEIRFRDIALSTSDWFWEVDAHGVYTYCSDKVEIALGYTAHEIVGRAPFDLMLPKEAERLGPWFQEMAAQKARIIDLENWNLHKDGHAVCLLTNGVPILDPQGNLVGYRGADKDITERKKVEEALHRSEEEYRQVVSTSTDSIMVFDATTKNFVDVNEAAVELYGYSKEEFLNINILDITGEEAKTRDSFDKVLQGKIAFVPLRYHKKKDGTVFPVEISASQFYVGDRTFVCGVVRDITERKKAEEALQREKDTAQMYLDMAGTMLMAIGADRKIALINQRGCQILGYREEELIGKNWFQTCLPKRLRDEVESVFVRLLAGEIEPIEYYENPVVTKDGDERIIAWHNTVLRDDQGRIIGTLSSAEDITERKLAEEELAKHREHLEELVDERTSALAKANAQLKQELFERTQVEAALCELNEHNEQLWSSLPSILIGVDPAGRVSHWNPAAVAAFDIPAHNVIGRPFLECGIQWKEREIAERIADLGTKDEVTYLRDVQYRRPGGDQGILNITISPFIGANSKKRSLLVLGEDVTERRALENQLAQGQKLESIGRLAAGIAHEINTPTQYVGDNTRFLQDAFSDLNPLLAKYAELLSAIKQEKTVTSDNDIVREAEAIAGQADIEYFIEEIPKAIGQTLDGVEHMAKIVRAMKDFSHPGVGKKTDVDINKVIESTITIARHEWKYVAGMIMELDPSLPTVSCMEGDINQVILNLVINAAQAIAEVVGDKSGEKGTITVRTRRNGDWAEIRISDTGPGIPEAVRDKVFDPFFTTKETGKGSGQGLAIAHSTIVNRNGGTISFETEEGRGTTFIVRLPIGNGTARKGIR
jgi:PAS domain S-box-containing protein